MWQELAEGQVHQGIVRSVKDFGAFVDLGGVDGLLHVSEMSWQRVKDISSIVQLGQTIKVVVLKIDRETRKVGLGLKQLTPSPWDTVAEKYHVGANVPGKVSRLMDFGAFVELEPAIEGLIHISELALAARLSRRRHRAGRAASAGEGVERRSFAAANFAVVEGGADEGARSRAGGAGRRAGGAVQAAASAHHSVARGNRFGKRPVIPDARAAIDRESVTRFKRRRTGCLSSNAGEPAA